MKGIALCHADVKNAASKQNGRDDAQRAFFQGSMVGSASRAADHSSSARRWTAGGRCSGARVAHTGGARCAMPNLNRMKLMA